MPPSPGSFLLPPAGVAAQRGAGGALPPGPPVHGASRWQERGRTGPRTRAHAHAVPRGPAHTARRLQLLPVSRDCAPHSGAGGASGLPARARALPGLSIVLFQEAALPALPGQVASRPPRLMAEAGGRLETQWGASRAPALLLRLGWYPQQWPRLLCGSTRRGQPSRGSHRRPAIVQPDPGFGPQPGGAPPAVTKLGSSLSPA